MIKIIFHLRDIIKAGMILPKDTAGPAPKILPLAPETTPGGGTLSRAPLLTTLLSLSHLHSRLYTDPHTLRLCANNYHLSQRWSQATPYGREDNRNATGVANPPTLQDSIGIRRSFTVSYTSGSILFAQRCP